MSVSYHNETHSYHLCVHIKLNDLILTSLAPPLIVSIFHENEYRIDWRYALNVFCEDVLAARVGVNGVNQSTVVSSKAMDIWAICIDHRLLHKYDLSIPY